MHGCMWIRRLFPPTTLSYTELTSYNWLIELLDIWELIYWTLILIKIPWVRWSVRYSHMQLVHSNCSLMHLFFLFVTYCNNKFIIVNDTVNSWPILIRFLCGLFCSVCIFILHLLQTLLELYSWISKWHSNSNNQGMNSTLSSKLDPPFFFFAPLGSEMLCFSRIWVNISICFFVQEFLGWNNLP